MPGPLMRAPQPLDVANWASNLPGPVQQTGGVLAQVIADLIGASTTQNPSRPDVAALMSPPVMMATDSELSPLAKAVANRIRQYVGGVAFHGTSASTPFQSFNTPVVYMTDDPREAASYARDAIIGGSRGAGSPRIVPVVTPPGRSLDITSAVNKALERGDDVDGVIASIAATARKGHIDYLTFDHPSSYGNSDIKAIVSIRPDKLSIEQPFFRAEPRAGRVLITGRNGQSAGIYDASEVNESLSNLEFGYQRSRPRSNVLKASEPIQ